MTPIERFAEKYVVCPETGCWDWTQSLDHNGYSRFRYGGNENAPGHIFSYEYYSGETIPNGMHIDHICRNRQCVNYLHLEVVSPAENNRRSRVSVNKPYKTHCPNGHSYKDNAYLTPNNGKTCKICTAERGAVRRAKLKELKARGETIPPVSKTHCPRGHLKSVENTYVKISTGSKECRVCRNTARRVRYHKRMNSHKTEIINA